MSEVQKILQGFIAAKAAIEAGFGITAEEKALAKRLTSAGQNAQWRLQLQQTAIAAVARRLALAAFISGPAMDDIDYDATKQALAAEADIIVCRFVADWAESASDACPSYFPFPAYNAEAKVRWAREGSDVQ